MLQKLIFSVDKVIQVYYLERLLQILIFHKHKFKKLHSSYNLSWVFFLGYRSNIISKVLKIIVLKFLCKECNHNFFVLSLPIPREFTILQTDFPIQYHFNMNLEFDSLFMIKMQSLCSSRPLIQDFFQKTFYLIYYKNH